MKRSLLVLAPLLAVACASGPAARPPFRVGGPSAWILSDKLDQDAKEFVLRSYDAQVTFPFRVRLSAPLDEAARAELAQRGVTLSGAGPRELVARSRPADLAGLVRTRRVVAVRCASPKGTPPKTDAWRAKVDPDVRTVHAARGACWTATFIRFSHLATYDDRRALEALGVVFHAFDAGTAIAFVPIRSIPEIAALPVIGGIAPASRATAPLP